MRGGKRGGRVSREGGLREEVEMGRHTLDWERREKQCANAVCEMHARPADDARSFDWQLPLRSSCHDHFSNAKCSEEANRTAQHITAQRSAAQFGTLHPKPGTPAVQIQPGNVSNVQVTIISVPQFSKLSLLLSLPRSSCTPLRADRRPLGWSSQRQARTRRREAHACIALRG